MRSAIAFLALFIISLQVYVTEAKQRFQLDYSHVELRRLKEVENEYYSHHYRKWIQASEKRLELFAAYQLQLESSENRTNSNLKDFSGLHPLYTLCYVCEGALVPSGQRFGCTERIGIGNFDGDKAWKKIFPCSGVCSTLRSIFQSPTLVGQPQHIVPSQVTRRLKGGTYTFTRTCFTGQCRDADGCYAESDGVCLSCCDGNFCNRDVPTAFMVEQKNNSTSGGTVHRSKTHVGCALLLIANLLIKKL